MAETNKAPAGKATKSKAAMNWPVLIVSAIFVAFVVFVWVNNYRVSHAASVPGSVTSTK